MEYEVWFETDYGMTQIMVRAASRCDLMKQLTNRFPDDVGADGAFIDPVSGDELPLEW